VRPDVASLPAMPAGDAGSAGAQPCRPGSGGTRVLRVPSAGARVPMHVLGVAFPPQNRSVLLSQGVLDAGRLGSSP